MARINDQLMIDIIKDGGYANGRGADMPAWRYALSEEDMRDLVAFIRRFCVKEARRDYLLRAGTRGRGDFVRGSFNVFLELPRIVRIEEDMEIFKHRLTPAVFVDVPNYGVGRRREDMSRYLVLLREVKFDRGLQLTSSRLQLRQSHVEAQLLAN
jgi:hypothetical protein